MGMEPRFLVLEQVHHLHSQLLYVPLQMELWVLLHHLLQMGLQQHCLGYLQRCLRISRSWSLLWKLKRQQLPQVWVLTGLIRDHLHQIYLSGTHLRQCPLPHHHLDTPSLAHPQDLPIQVQGTFLEDPMTKAY